MTAIRILFLADTHLGFDLPQRPRIERRRRGHDFSANFERALDTATQERVDLVVHGGDLFYRSRVPARLVQQVFMPLKRFADTRIPVYLVPGNHERSRIPYPMLALHPGIHIFDRPRTFVVESSGVKVALAGFPYHRDGVRSAFASLLDRTGWCGVEADINLLCVHHAFEGATVGSSNHTFRYEQDVVRLREIPDSFAAVLSGHIHRHQVLVRDLRGRDLKVPVLYPGSIERTSFAERDEPKGFLLLDFEPAHGRGGVLRKWDFRELPSRPMVIADLHGGGDGGRLESEISQVIATAPRDAILRIRIHGFPDERGRALAKAARLRDLAPATMNVEAVLVDAPRWAAKQSCRTS